MWLVSTTKLSFCFVFSLLSAIRWHFSHFDGFLCLTSVKKGSAGHSQCLPLDTDANRALTGPAPPSLRRALIHHSPNKADNAQTSSDAHKRLPRCPLTYSHESVSTSTQIPPRSSSIKSGQNERRAIYATTHVLYQASPPVTTHGEE